MSAVDTTIRYIGLGSTVRTRSSAVKPIMQVNILAVQPLVQVLPHTATVLLLAGTHTLSRSAVT